MHPKQMEPGEDEGKEDPMMSDGDMDSTEQFGEDGAMEGDDGAMESDGTTEVAMDGGDDMQTTTEGGDLGALVPSGDEDGSGDGDGFVDVGEEGGDGSIGTIVEGSIIEGTTFGGDSDGNPGTAGKQTKLQAGFPLVFPRFRFRFHFRASVRFG